MFSHFYKNSINYMKCSVSPTSSELETDDDSVSTFASLKMTSMTGSSNLIDFLKGREIVQKLLLIIVPISFWLLNSTVMQHRHGSNCHIFHCATTHRFPHDISGCRDRNADQLFVSYRHTDSKAPTSFHFSLFLCSLQQKRARHCVLCLHVITKWQEHA